MNERGPDAPTVAAFAAAVTVGGANFIAVRFSNRELEPFWGAGLRFATAALLFVGIALALRLRWPRGKVLLVNLAYGALSFAVSYALVYWALLRVTAGMASIVLAVVPLLTLLLSSLQGFEHLRPRGAMGAALALVGIAAMSVAGAELAVPITALVAMLAAAVAIAESIVLGRQLAQNHPAMTNAVGMTIGALLLLVLSVSAGEQWVLPQRTDSRLAVLYVTTVGSVGLFVLVLLVVRRWTPSATSYTFVLFPVVTLLLGALFLDEEITLRAVVGAVLVMSGVWFGALSPAARRTNGRDQPASTSSRRS